MTERLWGFNDETQTYDITPLAQKHWPDGAPGFEENWEGVPGEGYNHYLQYIRPNLDRLWIFELEAGEAREVAAAAVAWFRVMNIGAAGMACAVEFLQGELAWRALYRDALDREKGVE